MVFAISQVIKVWHWSPLQLVEVEQDGDLYETVSSGVLAMTE